MRYTKNWKEIAYQVKEKAGWKCNQCGHPDDYKTGYGLSVHHLNRIKSDNREENLVALCQRCHLRFEAVALKTARFQLTLFGEKTCVK